MCFKINLLLDPTTSTIFEVNDLLVGENDLLRFYGHLFQQAESFLLQTAPRFSPVLNTDVISYFFYNLKIENHTSQFFH